MQPHSTTLPPLPAIPCRACGQPFVRSRAHNHGDYFGDFCPNCRRTKTPRNTVENFWARYLPGEDGCLNWVGPICKRSGYGQIKFRGQSWQAHRLAWTFRHGPIPDNLHVCHTCDNRRCGADAHHFLGTMVDNIRDRHQKGRSRGPKGVKNGNAKLTDEIVRQIRALRRSGMKIEDIGRALGVGRSNVGNILCGLTWTHVV